ncbi:MAG: DMT family transporter [Cohaesibacteraceae bacterium]|nr:DMT family transporter [Cohaesibacteraceae bacterium]PCH80186.1 MAG: EamA family transporter [Hyphomicrobiales bacterium]
MSMRDWVLLFCLSFIWGSSFFLTALAVHEIPPFTLVLARTGIAAIALYIYLRAKGESVPGGWVVIRTFTFLGFFSCAIPFTLFVWAQASISSGLASIINATTPMFTILVAHFALADERLSPNKVIGVVLGIAGVAVLVGGNAMTGINIQTYGILACLGAAFCYGMAGIYGRRYKTMGISPAVGAFGQLLAASIMIAPIVIFVEQPWTGPTPGTVAVLAVLGIAIFTTAFAYLIFFRILASAGAVNVALVTLIIPVTAILLGSGFLGEVLETRHIAGMALIMSGLLAVDGRLWQRLKPKVA